MHGDETVIGIPTNDCAETLRFVDLLCHRSRQPPLGVLRTGRQVSCSGVSTVVVPWWFSQCGEPAVTCEWGFYERDMLQRSYLFYDVGKGTVRDLASAFSRPPLVLISDCRGGLFSLAFI